MLAVPTHINSIPYPNLSQGINGHFWTFMQHKKTDDPDWDA